MRVVWLVVLVMSAQFNIGHSQCAPIDIVVLVDYSGSVSGKEPYLYKAIEHFATAVKLSSTGVQVSAITFNSSTYLLCGLTADKDLYMDKLNSRPHPFAAGGSNMGLGLYNATNHLLTKGREHSTKMIIVISDGGVNETGASATLEIAEKAKQLGVSIFAVILQTEETDEQFMRNLAGNSLLTGYETLSEEIKRIDICL